MSKTLRALANSSADANFIQHVASAVAMFGVSAMGRRPGGTPRGLQSFSDRQLRDIGLMRGDFDPVHLSARLRAF